MGPDSTGYKIVFVLHLLAVIVGFGSLAFNGLSDAESRKRQASGRLAVIESNLLVTKWAEAAIYAVPVLGIGLVAMSDGLWEFSQIWIGLSLVLYLVALGVHHAMVRPATKQRIAVLAGAADGSGQAGADGIEGLDKKIATGSAVFNLAVVVIVVVMVFKPGA